MASRALAHPMAAAHRYLAAATSENTRSAYKKDWNAFVAWCKRVDLDPLPAAPADVARYLAQLADRKLKSSTITRHASAISYVHRRAGLAPPTEHDAIKATLRGIRRTLGTRRTKKAPATLKPLLAMLRRIPNKGLAALRDRALLLTGFGAGLRRSELVDLNVNDLELQRDGVLVQVKRSKTDQESRGATIPVPEGKKLKPVKALRAWLKAAGITRGPLFRPVDRHGRVGPGRLTDRSVARIVKRAAKAAGLDERGFSGHSLRAGFVTESLDHDVDLFRIMDVTRHVKVETVREYDRRKRSFASHAGKQFM
jgi:site-specific recombinase XerD